MFLPNTSILSRNIGYLFWMILLVVFIVSLPFFFKDEKDFLKLVRIYLLSFTAIALFGLFQFLLGLYGISFYITQWWMSGRLPRINAFSYEPSYFSTYVLIAWVTYFYLLVNKNYHNKYFYSKWCFSILTLSLILSTSRMGLIIMGLIIVIYLFQESFRVFTTLRIKKITLVLSTGFFMIIGVVSYYLIFKFNKIKFILAGMGVMGQTNHSSGQRLKELQDTFQAFLNSPFIGRSLGGVPSAIAQVRGAYIHFQWQTKSYEGMNVFVETLVTSGIFGFLFFITFLIVLFYKTARLASQIKKYNRAYSGLLYALLLALFFELVLLNMNQNILRIYLWVHIGMVNLGYFIGLSMYRNYKSSLYPA
ncbi:MAG: O-antigen ligase family protein [Cytophagaceae bacterium]